MMVRVRARRAAVACLGALAWVIATGTACSPEPLSVATVIDFSGEWVLSDSVSGLVVGGEMPPRICRTWDRPMHLWLDSGENTWGALEQFGGSVSCGYEGVFEEPRLLTGNSHTYYLEVGADSTILFNLPGSNQDGAVRYRATTISANRLAGKVYLPIFGRPDDGAPHGTWEMIRSY